MSQINAIVNYSHLDIGTALCYSPSFFNIYVYS